MKTLILSLMLIVTVIQTGCITSLQPLVTYDTVISDERLPGKWKTGEQEYQIHTFYESDFYKKHKKDLEDDDKKTKTHVEKTKQDSILLSKSYIVEYYKEGFSYVLLAALVRLNGQLFINFTPVDMTSLAPGENETEINYNNRISTNTIARVQFRNANSVQVDFLDGGFIYDEVKAGHLKIKNERDDLFDTFMITASSTELQQFLRKYGNDQRIYRKENSVTLTRKSGNG